MKPPEFDEKNWKPVPRVQEWPVYQPEAIPTDWKLITTTYEKRGSSDYDWKFYFHQEILIIYRHLDTINRFNGTPIRHIEQYEFPIQGARWFVDNIKRFFLKPGEPGALPAHKFSLAEYCGDEKLGISRLADCYASTPGYCFKNQSRCEHPDQDLCQCFDMSDEALFKEGGYLALFTDIAERYERGELEEKP
ncbi:hypothetical protein [Teredinibacter turnerae]|uniref:hypothetical protein n=1 Tax=Teredinibacter turnerae TaxID=2426 RepID=UPI00041E7F1D|nr:hypothetical protein [Teredinibacter turnerae]